MSFIDKILSTVVPYECIACGFEGELACSACLREFMDTSEECYRCRRSSAGSLTCLECITSGVVRRASASMIYQGVAKDLVWRLKSSGAQAAAKTMATQMFGRLERKDYLIVPAPTAPDRVRQRGYDQSRLLARQLARLSGLPWSDCLVRTSHMHQVGADKDTRLTQLKNAFAVKNVALVRDVNILIVDDVITTGATVESAAAPLLAAGANMVEALAFARPLINRKTPSM